VRLLARPRRRDAAVEQADDRSDPGTTPIGDLIWRQRARVAGRVRSVRVQPLGGVPTLECILVDASGGVAVVFLGRRDIAGIRPGRRLVVDGVFGAHDGRLAVVNPVYELLPEGP
jgi:hypothetical protein